jgi:hypothetical protein
MTHAGMLPNGLTLCGLPTNENKCGWVFTKEGMIVESGQMLSLYKDRVSCKICQDKVPMKTSCQECGQEL